MPRISFPWQSRTPVWRPAGPAQAEAAIPLSGGTEISLQEAADLLHKLREESAQVQAIYSGSNGVSSALRGFVRTPIDDGLWSIAPQEETKGAALSFDLNAATVRRFGDESSMSGAVSFPFRFRFASALCFGFGDGSTLSLLELCQDQTATYR